MIANQPPKVDSLGVRNGHDAQPEPLFRNEVLFAREHASLGRTALFYPISQTVWAISAVVLTVVLVGWMSIGEYSRRLRVHGALVPSGGIIKLKARASGEILKLHVVIGDAVRAGDPILLLGTDKATEGISEVGDTVAESLGREIITLKTDIAILSEAAAQEISALQREISALREQLAREQDELQIYTAETDRQQITLETTRDLVNKGYIAEIQLRTQESQLSHALAEQGRQTSLIASTIRQVQDAEYRLSQAPRRAQVQINDVTRDLARAEASIAKTESDRNILVKAPADGEIAILSVHQGQTVEMGQSIGSILPPNSILLAEFLVPSSVIGSIEIGSRVAVRYDAFPYQKFGVHWGTVVSISKTALTPNEIGEASGGPATTDSRYRISVSLPAQSVAAAGRQRQLLVGMTIEADLMLERRRIVEWLFEPIYSLQSSLEGIP